MYRFRRLSITTAALALFGVAAIRPAEAQNFNVVSLGTLGGTTSQSNAVNNASKVVGAATTGAAATHAFLFDTSMHDLGTLGGSSSTALAVNSAGDTAGQSANASAALHAFYLTGGVMNDLGTFGGASSIASALNNNGFTAGGALDASAAMRAFFHSGTGALVAATDDIGTLGGTTAQAFALNDSNVVAGQSNITGDTAHHAFVWDSVNGMMDLGTLGGTNSAALGLNGISQVIGQSDITGNAAHHAFLFDSGAMMDLGTLGGTNSTANAINGSAQVVGQADTASATHAFLWDANHGMVDLNSLIPSGTGWVLVNATAINDKGEISGFGTFGGQTRAFLLTVIPNSIMLNPKNPIGGSQVSTLTVFLGANAPAGGTVVSVSTSNASVAVFANNSSSSSSFTIPAGASSGTILINTGIVGADTPVTITAAFGSTTKTDTLTVRPLLAGISLRPSTVVGGAQSATLVVSLNGPTGGVTVGLSSSDGNLAVFDNNGSSGSSLAIPAGARSASAIIDTGGVNVTKTVNISVTLGGATFTKKLTLMPLLKSVALNPTSVVGGSMTSTFTVTLNMTAPSGGTGVSLISSNGNLAVFANNSSSNSAITIPAGSNTGTVIINTGGVKANSTVTISGTVAGLTLSQTLAITPWLKTFVLNPTSVVGGAAHSTATVTLNAQAPPGGVTVTLGSNDGTTAVFDNNGGSSSSVLVAAGARSATVIIDTFVVGVNKTPTITATLSGLAKTAKLTVTPILSGITVNPGTIIGGCQKATVTVTLFAAPLSGLGVSLSSSSSSLAVFDNNGSSSSAITIPTGATSGFAIIDTGIVGAKSTATITATVSSLAKTGTLTLLPALASVSLSPASVVGGCQQSTGTVTLNAPAPAGGIGIGLASSNGSFAVFDNNGSSSSAVTIPAGSTTVSFVIDTAIVGVNSNVTISATLAGLTKTTVLTLTPALASLSLSPSSVVGGGTSTGTVTLNAPAPGGGVGVSLSSSNGSIAVFANNGSSSSAVVIPAGSTSVTFIINTGGVGSSTNVNISATVAGLTFTQVLNVHP